MTPGETNTLEIQPGAESIIEKRRLGASRVFPNIEVEPNAPIFAITGSKVRVTSIAEWQEKGGSFFRADSQRTVLILQNIHRADDQVVTFHDKPCEN